MPGAHEIKRPARTVLSVPEKCHLFGYDFLPPVGRFLKRQAVYGIGLAAPHEVSLLPEIERRACELFLAFPSTAEIPLHLTPLEEFEFAQRAHLLWTARAAGAPIGFALVEPLGPGLHLEELDVLPEQGRKGVGCALVREVCRYAQAQGRVLSLCTFRDVPWNAPFYTRLGFQTLCPEEIWPELLARVQEEAARGLRSELRVAMRYVGGT